jgi:pre-mRNA-splicing factor SYF1
LLRQNPNNVHEWEKRVALWKDNHAKVIFYLDYYKQF